MYKLNKSLIIREDDNSIFSLENMEIYEFNEVGFISMMYLFKDGVESFDDWKEKIIDIPNIDIEDIEQFWDDLIKRAIIVEQ